MIYLKVLDYYIFILFLLFVNFVNSEGKENQKEKLEEKAESSNAINERNVQQKDGNLKGILKKEKDFIKKEERNVRFINVPVNKKEKDEKANFKKPVAEKTLEQSFDNTEILIEYFEKTYKELEKNLKEFDYEKKENEKIEEIKIIENEEVKEENIEEENDEKKNEGQIKEIKEKTEGEEFYETLELFEENNFSNLLKAKETCEIIEAKFKGKEEFEEFNCDELKKVLEYIGIKFVKEEEDINDKENEVEIHKEIQKIFVELKNNWKKENPTITEKARNYTKKVQSKIKKIFEKKEKKENDSPMIKVNNKNYLSKFPSKIKKMLGKKENKVMNENDNPTINVTTKNHFTLQELLNKPLE
uniref:Uncharacterized protein n=1 Tax=Meloidogyne hapla TaxID=6305 RepID=A0A1I8B2H7_MELHA